MKNSAIDSTSEILNADQMSMCRNCRRARRGPRPAAFRPRPDWPRLLAGAPAAALPAGVPPVAGVAGAEPLTGPAAADAPVAGPCARRLPVVGMACVVETEAGAASSP